MYNRVELKINKINEGAIMPTYAHMGDSGMDLHIPNNYFKVKEVMDSIVIEDGTYTLQPLERIIIKTGLKVSFGSQYELQIRSKSGRAIKEGLVVINQPGTVEFTYQGEICVGLINLSNEPIILENGKPIAQMVLAPVVNHTNSDIYIREYNNVPDDEFYPFKTSRGNDGIGSTYLEFNKGEK